MILFVLVCVMSLTMAHPQQSLSPTQSLRRDVRFVQTKSSFKDTLTTWVGAAKKKYCAVRAVVEKEREKHPMAFFVAQKGLYIGGKYVFFYSEFTLKSPQFEMHTTHVVAL